MPSPTMCPRPEPPQQVADRAPGSPARGGGRRPWNGVEEIPPAWGPSAITIGVFDGVHRGHTRLIERTIQAAQRHRVPSVLVTFDPHPARVIGPPRDTATLSTPARRAELAGRLGVDAVLVLPFTPALARTPADAFATRVLVDNLHAVAVVVGRNFRFGAGGKGDLATLRHLGHRHGFTVEGVPLLHTAQSRCSSTYVRHCLSSGDLAAATRALGRPHRVEGRLSEGTLTVPAYTALPPQNRRFPGLLTLESGITHPVSALVAAPDTIRLLGGPHCPEHSWAALDLLAADQLRRDDYPNSPP
ncbi:MAG: hypothetical protein ACK5MT_13250 [Actinomycetales bacterium]